jgi:hypothetical protein
MECTLPESAMVAPSRGFVMFEVSFRGQTLVCSIAREALEQYFWAPIGGTDAQLLRAYVAGRPRIEAMVARRLHRNASEPVVLVAGDFNRVVPRHDVGPGFSAARRPRRRGVTCAVAAAPKQKARSSAGSFSQVLFRHLGGPSS